MDTDRPLLKRSEVECMTITIVGVLGPITDADAANAQIRALLQDIEAAVYAHYPGFQPAYPPVTITVVALPELRSNDA